MGDFPSALVSPQQSSLSTFGPTSPCMDLAVGQSAVPTSLTWPSANVGIFTPVWVEQQVTAYKMAIIVGTQSGNADVGIYDEFGNALVRAGSTAVAAAGIQIFDIADTLLQPGLYLLALACDNTTAAFRGVNTHGGLAWSAGQSFVASAFSSGLIATVTYAKPTASLTPIVMASLVATL